MKNLLKILLLTAAGWCVACQPEAPSREQRVQETARAYFSVYQQREDWDSLLSFYRNDIRFRDANLNYDINGIADFKEFYNWPDTSFRKIVPDQKHLVLETLVVQDSMVVGQGRLRPFFWNDKLQEWPEDFTIWLFFDDSLKIHRQVDWVRYPAWMIESFEQ